MEYLRGGAFSVGSYRPNPDKCCEACVFGRGEHTGVDLCTFPDEWLESFGVRPRLHWHRDSGRRCWLVPLDAYLSEELGLSQEEMADFMVGYRLWQKSKCHDSA